MWVQVWSRRKWRPNCREEKKPSAFISNNSLSLVYCTLCWSCQSPFAKQSPKNITANTWHMHLQSCRARVCVWACVCRCMCVCVCAQASIAVGSEEFSMNNWTWRGEKPAVQKAKCQLPGSFYFKRRGGGAKGGVRGWIKEGKKKIKEDTKDLKRHKFRLVKPRVAH